MRLSTSASASLHLHLHQLILVYMHDTAAGCDALPVLVLCLPWLYLLPTTYYMWQGDALPVLVVLSFGASTGYLGCTCILLGGKSRPSDRQQVEADRQKTDRQIDRSRHPRLNGTQRTWP